MAPMLPIDPGRSRLARVLLVALLFFVAAWHSAPPATRAQPAPDTVRLRSGERLTVRVLSISPGVVVLEGGAVNRAEVDWIAFRASELPGSAAVLPQPSPTDAAFVVDGEVLFGRVLAMDPSLLRFHDGASERLVQSPQVNGIDFCEPPCIMEGLLAEQIPGGTSGTGEGTPSGETDASQGPTGGGGGPTTETDPSEEPTVGGGEPQAAGDGPCVPTSVTIYKSALGDGSGRVNCSLSMVGCGGGIELKATFNARQGGKCPWFEGTTVASSEEGNICCADLRRCPDDADCDGVPDAEDRMPFTPGGRSSSTGEPAHAVTNLLWSLLDLPPAIEAQRACGLPTVASRVPAPSLTVAS